MMRIRSAARTHTGYHRKNNEDAWHAEPALGLYLVCDGMGGHEDGEVASRLAVEAVSGAIARTFRRGRLPSFEEGRRSLREAILEAHRRIIEESERRELEVPMGTTIVAALLLREVALVASTGDSRAYLLSRAGNRQITCDHTVAEHYASMGLIASEQVQNHPLKSVLVRALGSPVNAEPDLHVVPLARGDRLLLCTDGLTDRLPRDTILAAAQASLPLDQVLGRLIELALDAGGHDNVTVLVVEREDGGASVSLPDEDSGDSLATGLPPVSPSSPGSPTPGLWAGPTDEEDD